MALLTIKIPSFKRTKRERDLTAFEELLISALWFVIICTVLGSYIYLINFIGTSISEGFAVGMVVMPLLALLIGLLHMCRTV